MVEHFIGYHEDIFLRAPEIYARGTGAYLVLQSRRPSSAGPGGGVPVLRATSSCQRTIVLTAVQTSPQAPARRASVIFTRPAVEPAASVAPQINLVLTQRQRPDPPTCIIVVHGGVVPDRLAPQVHVVSQAAERPQWPVHRRAAVLFMRSPVAEVMRPAVHLFLQPRRPSPLASILFLRQQGLTAHWSVWIRDSSAPRYAVRDTSGPRYEVLMAKDWLYTDGNDDRAKAKLTRENETTGEVEAASGLTGLTLRLSASPNGVAIHSSLSKPAVERGTSGFYYATFEGSDLAAHLAAFIGKVVYQTCGDGINVNDTVPRRVKAVRP